MQNYTAHNIFMQSDISDPPLLQLQIISLHSLFKTYNNIK
ncbi:hypothetical protein HMPREF1991_03058 [Hoylesella loescheii DSM 19665 = JCM 12249 = ATCC 15930]|uniref:Uncharacterized protein n=1 Tax=Hoylesella loescheii DSM 19665 = JCM 12249 = ATCC 15930 TaxID=1122985 RepID=A0A069QM04_HOYLO|nr:hypothetical protein HMPREF1991_03058 [Hoylesella loescheii DSM 19665 = JCM 12249 = ATCC 15930]